MSAIKKAWLGPFATNNDLHSLSLESSSPEEPWTRIKVKELVFPDKPTQDNPLRHTVNIGLFSLLDLIRLRNALNDYIENCGD